MSFVVTGPNPAFDEPDVNSQTVWRLFGAMLVGRQVFDRLNLTSFKLAYQEAGWAPERIEQAMPRLREALQDLEQEGLIRGELPGNDREYWLTQDAARRFLTVEVRAPRYAP
jgi:hypothetical protein